MKEAPYETDRIRGHAVVPLGQRRGAAGAGTGEDRPVFEAADGKRVAAHLSIALEHQIGYNRDEQLCLARRCSD